MLLWMLLPPPPPSRRSVILVLAVLFCLTQLLLPVTHGQDDNDFDDASATSSCEELLEASLPDRGQRDDSFCSCHDEDGNSIRPSCTFFYPPFCDTLACRPEEDEGYRCPEGVGSIDSRLSCATMTEFEYYDISINNNGTNITTTLQQTSRYLDYKGMKNIDSLTLEYFPRIIGGPLETCKAYLQLKGGDNSTTMERQTCISCTVCDENNDGRTSYDCTNLIPEAIPTTCDSSRFEREQLFELDIPTCSEFESSLESKRYIGMFQDSISCNCYGRFATCWWIWNNVCDTTLRCGTQVRCSTNETIVAGEVCRTFIIEDRFLFRTDWGGRIPYELYEREISADFTSGVLEPDGSYQVWTYSPLPNQNLLHCTQDLILDGIRQSCTSCTVCPDDGSRKVDCTNLIPESIPGICGVTTPNPPGPLLLLVDTTTTTSSHTSDGAEQDDDESSSTPTSSSMSPTPAIVVPTVASMTISPTVSPTTRSPIMSSIAPTPIEEEEDHNVSSPPTTVVVISPSSPVVADPPGSTTTEMPTTIASGGGGTAGHLHMMYSVSFVLPVVVIMMSTTMVLLVVI